MAMTDEYEETQDTNMWEQLAEQWKTALLNPLYTLAWVGVIHIPILFGT